jgi:hypothetical protein
MGDDVMTYPCPECGADAQEGRGDHLPCWKCGHNPVTAPGTVYGGGVPDHEPRDGPPGWSVVDGEWIADEPIAGTGSSTVPPDVFGSA